MENLQCPISATARSIVTMGHGGGGKLTSQLIDDVFRKAFSNPILDREHDSAVLPAVACRRAFTTDSFVVSPLFFAGGNIGDLAVNGTVNDLLCSGAVPRYLSASFVLEEGFGIETLRQIAYAMRKAADKAGVAIVTGDTKVVERGRCDGVYINTSGIGDIPDGVDVSPRRVKTGDVVIATGEIGNHGVCILSTRKSLGFETRVQSDTAALVSLVKKLLDAVPDVHVLRDPTRGGVAATLHEIARSAQVAISIDELSLPVNDAVASACDLLGIDVLSVANEGIMLAFVPEEYADKAIDAIRSDDKGRNAVAIGRVVGGRPAGVYLEMPLGQTRVIELPGGEVLPRIC